MTHKKIWFSSFCNFFCNLRISQIFRSWARMSRVTTCPRWSNCLKILYNVSYQRDAARKRRKMKQRGRERERREKERESVATQEEREQKVPFHEVFNRGTWRCTFRDLCAHLPSGPSTSTVVLSWTAKNPFLSASMMSTDDCDEEKTGQPVNRTEANYTLLVLITTSSSMNNCYRTVRPSPSEFARFHDITRVYRERHIIPRRVKLDNIIIDIIITKARIILYILFLHSLYF